MITGKFSALKGFGLLIAVVAAIMSMIGCIITKEAALIIASVANLVIVGGSSYYLYRYWSSDTDEE